MSTNEVDPSLVLLPDGRFLLASIGLGGPLDLIRVTRFLPSGLLDTSFGTGGNVMLSAGGDLSNPELVVQPDGRIVVVGLRTLSVISTFVFDVMAMRLTASGALDPTFGGGGIAVPLPAGLRFPADVLLQPDGRIVVVGEEPALDGNRNPWAFRLDADGQLDPTYGVQGYQLISNSATDERVRAAALQADGRLLLAGRIGSDDLNDQFLVRLTPVGTLDPSFSGDGLAALDLSPGGDDLATDILPGTPVSPILVAGTCGGLMCVSAVVPGAGVTGVEDAPDVAPSLLAAGAPWPSPTRGAVTLALRLGARVPLTVDVLDVQGRRLRSLAASEMLPAGEHRMHWDGRDARGHLVAAGLYFVRVRAEDRVVSRRVVVAR